MRSTLELPDELLADVKRLANIRTNREAVQVALEELKRHLLRERLRARLGHCDLLVTQEDLQAWRAED